MRVTVIGAGMIGVSVAAELAVRGAEVTLIDQRFPGGGSSATSFAWVNSNNKRPDSYFELNRAGLEAHHRLAAGGGEWLHETGHVEIASNGLHQAELAVRVDRLTQLGYPVETISVSRAKELIPDLILPDGTSSATFYPREAHCDPSLYIRHMLALGTAHGLNVRFGAAVAGISAEGSTCAIQLDDGTVFTTDRVVSAAGMWTDAITAIAGLPAIMVESERGNVTMGYLAITNSLPVSIDRVLTSPQLNVRPAGGGRLILQALELDNSAEVDVNPALDSSLADDFVCRLRAVLDHTEGAAIREIQVAQRAIPKDGLSVIGCSSQAPWLYLVATHSGVTLAPLLGAGVAAELFGDDEPLFADFRPDRLFAGARHSAPTAPRRPGEQ